ncbi:MAG: hypothetical protein Q8R20_00220, partial [Nanoarchaeota archaeon]|nr:hypothetical protein [Nanoarchaeota archaeon]
YLREILAGDALRNPKQVIVALNMPGNDWYEMPSLPQKIDPELSQFLRGHERYRRGRNSLLGKIKNLLGYSQSYMFLRQTVAPAIKHAVLEAKDTTKAEEKEYLEIGPPVEELIETIVSIAKEKDVPISFVFLPERSFYFNKVPLYVTRLQEFMKKNDIRFFDLLPSMRGAYRKTSDFWQPIEGHYNAGGHAFIASEIQKANIIECGDHDSGN